MNAPDPKLEECRSCLNVTVIRVYRLVLHIMVHVEFANELLVLEIIFPKNSLVSFLKFSAVQAVNTGFK